LVTTASLVEAVLMVMVALGLLKALGKEEEEEEDVVVVQREDVVVIVLVLVVVTVLVTVLAVLAPATAGSSRTSRFGQRWSEPAACTRLQSQASPGSIVSGRWSCLLSVRRRCLHLLLRIGTDRARCGGFGSVMAGAMECSTTNSS
jgi:hypothetical protein